MVITIDPAAMLDWFLSLYLYQQIGLCLPLWLAGAMFVNWIMGDDPNRRWEIAACSLAIWPLFIVILSVILIFVPLIWIITLTSTKDKK